VQSEQTFLAQCENQGAIAQVTAIAQTMLRQLPPGSILLSTQGRDLGGVTDDVKQELTKAEHDGLPLGTQLIMRGQVETMRASFDGTVTARLVDVGALITDGTSQQLFRLAQAHILRVYVHP